MKNVREMSMEEFDNFAYNELDRIVDFDLLILKGHLIIEYTLNCYLESISQIDNSDFSKENLTFANKVNIVKHFGKLCNKDSNLINEFILLNKLRNSISHSLVFNDAYLEDFFKEFIKKGVQIEKIKHNRDKFIATIAFLSGAIQAAYKNNCNSEEVDNYLKNNNTQTF